MNHPPAQRPTNRAPLRRIAAEAFDNIATGRFLSVIVALTAFAAIGGVGLAETYAADAAIERETAFRRAGGYVSEIRAVTPQGQDTTIDRAACERLELSTAITASGSLGAATDAPLTATPDDSVGLIAASPGMTRVLQAMNPEQRYPTDSLVIADERYEQLELTSTKPITVGDLQPAVVIAAQLDTLAPGYNRAALTFGPTTGRAISCYIAVQPGTSTTPATLLAPLADPNARIAPLINTANTPPVDLYNNRPERNLWWIAAIIIAAAAAITLWVRRGDLALYRALGTNTTDIRTITTIEHLTLITIGGTTGLLLALTIARIQNQRNAAIDHGLWAALTALATSLTITAAATFITRHRNPLEQLKDR